MLVLGRKTNEQVCINGDIEVTILRIDSNRVTLGISAPREVTIRRGGAAEAARLGVLKNGGVLEASRGEPQKMEFTAFAG